MQALRDKTMSVTGKIMIRNGSKKSASATLLRLPRRAGNFLLAGLLGYSIGAGALLAGALAASVLPAQAPLSEIGLTLQTEQTAAAQPMPPMPDQVYDARFHEGAADLEQPASFAGIDPFITGPVPK